MSDTNLASGESATERPTTSGGQRGCGERQKGAAYLAIPLVPGGCPIEHFLIDPPIIVNPEELGISPVGVSLLGHAAADGGEVHHVYDIVGREHYPTVAEFVEEARRMGISRRIAATSDFSKITAESRLLLLHSHADIANALEFPTDQPCPCRTEGHNDPGYSEMCVRLWEQEPLKGAQHRLAIFASFRACQIEVIHDPDQGTHEQTITAAQQAAIPVVEVQQ
jgi:hypothetical protein